MRLIWFTEGTNVTLYDIDRSVNDFMTKFNNKPISLKMTTEQYKTLYYAMHKTISLLERGKQYGHFYPIPGGMIEIIVDDSMDIEVSNYNTAATKFIVLENKVDEQAFEKEILGQL